MTQDELDAIVDAWIGGALEQIDKWVDEGVGVLELRDNCIHLCAYFAGELKGARVITLDQVPAVLDKTRNALNVRLTERLPMHPAALWQLSTGVPTVQ